MELLNCFTDGKLNFSTVKNKINEIIEYFSNFFNINEAVVDTIEELESLDGVHKVAIVKDKNRGGTFVFDESRINENDGGVVFNGWVRQFSDIVNIKWFGAIGDSIVNDIDYIQKAVDYCVKNNIPLYVPQGTYIIGTSITGAGEIRINNLTDNYQGLEVIGDGIRKTIFKHQDGHMEKFGRYARMFFAYLDDTNAKQYKHGSFSFKKITFDKNARSNSSPENPYDWEQSHIISFAGNSVELVKNVVFEECEFYDKTAACINMATSATEFENVVLKNCISIEHPTVTEREDWGTRGCYEFGADTRFTVIENSQALYSQIEPVVGSSEDRRREYIVSNCKIDTFEFTDSGLFSSIAISNLISKRKFLTRGVKVKATNSILKVYDFFTSPEMFISNSKILLKYNEETNTSSSFYVYKSGYAGVASDVKQNIQLSNCMFEIDTDLQQNINGYALISSLTSNAEEVPNIQLDNCMFDSRLQGTVKSYSKGGNYILNNCTLAGWEYAIEAGSYSSYPASIEANNCNFSNVTGLCLRLLSNNELWKLKISGTYDINEWSQSNYTVNDYIDVGYSVRPILKSLEIPTTGYFFKGDTIMQTNPTPGGNIGFVCTESGESGVWKYFGAIES